MSHQSSLGPVSILIAGMLAFIPSPAAGAEGASLPNFVVIYGEGSGWTSTSVQALARTAEGIDFMERQVKEGCPFYLQLSHYPDQAETGAPQRRPEPTDKETLIVDQTLGQLLDAVQRLRLKDSTYILYTATTARRVAIHPSPVAKAGCGKVAYACPSSWRDRALRRAPARMRASPQPICSRRLPSGLEPSGPCLKASRVGVFQLC